MASSLVRSLVSNWGGQVVSVAIGLFVPSFVIRTLGNETYGVWALLVSLVSQLSLLDFGARHAVVRLSAKYHGDGNDSEIRRLITEVVRFISTGALLGTIGMLIVAYFFGGLFVVPEQELLTAKIVLVVLTIDAVCDLLSGPYSSVLGGIERYDLLQLGNTGRLFLNAVLVVLFLSLGWGLAGVAAALVVSRFAYRAYLIRIVHTILSQKAAPNEKPQLIDAKDWGKGFFRFGMLTTVMILGGKICYQIDLLVIGTFLTAASITSYAVPLLLVDQLRTFVESAQLVLFSRLSKVDQAKWTSNALPLLDKWARYSPLLLLTIGVHLFIFGGDFIRLWIGREMADGELVLQLLLLSLCVSVPLQGYTSALLARGRPGLIARVILCEAVVNITLSCILVRFLGIVGVAMATFIATILVQSIGVVLLWQDVSGYALIRWLKNGILPYLVLAPLYLIVVHICRTLIGTGSLPLFLLANALPLPLLILIVLKFVVLPEDLRYLLRRLNFSQASTAKILL